jgi:DNA-binding NarL/FixJ family response regulator
VNGLRVVIADDQKLVRAGFAMILGAQPGIEIVGEAGNGAEAIRVVRAKRPDVVLMDVRMPELDGLAATRELLSEGPVGRHIPKILILTTFDVDDYVYEALAAGASGFLLKDTPPEQLVEAVRSVAAGDSLLAPTVTRRLIEHFVSSQATREQPPDGMDELTPRELEVFKLVARGLSNTEIAGELVVSEATVKTHVARILLKLGLRDRVQVVVTAYESGIVRPGDDALSRPDRVANPRSG